MKAFLMHADQDFDLERELPPHADDLIQDLELGTLLRAMAAGDQFLLDVALKAVLASLTDPEAIAYRQHVLADCLAQPSVVREIYDIAVEAVVREKKEYFGLFRDSPDTILHRSVRVLELFVSLLRKLRTVADEHAGDFQSEGFTRLFAMLSKELGDEYFSEVEGHLRELKFRRGVLISAGVGEGNKGIHYVLRRLREQRWIERISPGGRAAGYSFQIADRDDRGFRALSDLQARGINLAANALAQSVDHILSFFSMLRAELAFYVGCLNLHGLLAGKGEPACFPVPLAAGQPAMSARGLYDPCLTLHVSARVVGNDVNADGKSLVMITGANQGGKSTFLRSAGLAQLMMQCGMFAPAQSFQADVCNGVFTHYKREEDATIESGKLDEELGRMSGIVDQITPGCILLCNESFASTNEREGSQIARQIVRALLARDVKLIFVTHLFDLAQRLHLEGMEIALFLHAERQADGRRTFRVAEGEPLPTSHGEDVYRRIFAADLDRAPAR
jgi:DNA mismatch repair ATPase MutS